MAIDLQRARALLAQRTMMTESALREKLRAMPYLELAELLEREVLFGVVPASIPAVILQETIRRLRVLP